MTATEVLATLEARGVEVRAEGDHIHFRPRAAAEDLVEAMRTVKPELLKLLAGRSGASPWPEALPGLGARRTVALGRCARCRDASSAAYGEYCVCLPCARWLDSGPLAAYVAILRRLWPLHTSTDLAAIQEALKAQTRLAEALGDDLAALVERAEGQRWYAETGRCPTCGELGEFHEPEDA